MHKYAKNSKARRHWAYLKKLWKKKKKKAKKEAEKETPKKKRRVSRSKARRDILKVTKLSQLKYVANTDLHQIGLSKPEIRRYRKIYGKQFPNPYMNKIKKLLNPKSKSEIVPQCNYPNSIDHQPFLDSNVIVPTKHIISMEDITINKELGMGQFGVVQQGTWNTGQQRLQVAIKCLGHERMTSNSTEFLKEAAVMHSIEHPNVVRLYGVVLHLDNLMLVTELAPLRSLLECLREVSLRPNFPVPTLCEFAEQICDGMTYLEQKRLIHRDLAARNILVFTKDKVKISDFGLSRALGVGKDYYQTNYNVNLKLPVAWCAPECILYLRFTSASDVWAFGVCLWEMFTYGFQPWAAFSGQQILEAIDAPNCQRLERPECCPAAYYALMLHCWEHEAIDRPKFKDLCQMLRNIRPEQVQAIANYHSPEDGRRGNFLEYKAGQIITVLNKGYMNTGMWYGVLPGGTCGVFDPNHTRPYCRSEPPHQVVTPYKPADDMEIPLLNSPSHTKAGRCKPPYPRNLNPDFDEVDLPYRGRFPLRMALMKPPDSDEDDNDDTSSPETKPKTFKKHFSKHLDPTTSKSIINRMKSATLGRSRSEEVQTVDVCVHEYHEISDTDTDSPVTDRNNIANRSEPELLDSATAHKGNTDFSESLLKEVDSVFWSYVNRGLDRGSSRFDDIEPSSGRSQSLGKADKKKPDETDTMKPMSAHDVKTLDTAVALANEITTKSMTDLDSEQKTAKSQNERARYLLKFANVSLNYPAANENNKGGTAAKTTAAKAKGPRRRPERHNFSEEARNVRDIQATLSEESKQAYMSLIEQPTPSAALMSQITDEVATRQQQKPPLKPKPTTLLTRNRATKPEPKRIRFFNKPRSSTDESINGDDTPAPGVNKLPLPPRANKPILVNKPRHVRKYPLKMPEAEVEKQEEEVSSEKPIIYHNDVQRKEKPPVETKEVVTQTEDIDVCDSGPTGPVASFNSELYDNPTPGPSHANPLEPYQPNSNPVDFEDTDESDDSDSDYFREFDESNESEDDEKVSRMEEGGSYVTGDHVSVEDLLEFADQKPSGQQRGVESDEVRIMIKVLKQQADPEECLRALEITNWNVYEALKIIRVKLLIGDTFSVSLDDCARELAYNSGDVRKASTLLVLCKPTKGQ